MVICMLTCGYSLSLWGPLPIPPSPKGLLPNPMWTSPHPHGDMPPPPQGPLPMPSSAPGQDRLAALAGESVPLLSPCHSSAQPGRG